MPKKESSPTDSSPAAVSPASLSSARNIRRLDLPLDDIIDIGTRRKSLDPPPLEDIVGTRRQSLDQPPLEDITGTRRQSLVRLI